MDKYRLRLLPKPKHDMERLSSQRFKRLRAWALVLCLLSAGMEAQAQNKARVLAECQEELKSKLIELKAQKDGALLRARDDEEANGRGEVVMVQR